MSGHLYILKIEIDGHFRGSPDVPKPWVAEIGGLCPKYGLERKFVQTMNDWSEARRAWSGNIYGRVAHFPLRDGNLYEVSRLRGRPSKRHVAREFIAIESGNRVELDPEEALERVDGGGLAALFSLPEDPDGGSWVARIVGLGTPERLGFVVVDGRRKYRLRDGLYEVMQSGERRFVAAQDQQVTSMTERESLQWLLANVA